MINLPLGTGDRVWSADDGRVEIMFEDGTTLWLDAASTLDFVSLPRPGREQSTILRLWAGSLFVERPVVQGVAFLPLRVDAPSGAVLLADPGLFRIDVDDEQRVWLSAYDGVAVLEAGGLSERVTAGNRTFAELDSAPALAVAFNTMEADNLTAWRDDRRARYASTRQYVSQREYVPQNIAAYAADLEPYGTWGYDSEIAAWYWRPTAALAWTPYRDGRWVYTYSGWTWVPAAPWGWVTSHYGRWHYGGGAGWVWFPGRVWTPASVRWYVGSSHVGWVPLNYYGRPAVSFGVHVGGGFGLSVGISVGASWGYGYPGYGYPGWGWGYGWGHPGWGWRYPRYGYGGGCCWSGWGSGYWGGGWHGGHYPVHLPAGRRHAVYVGPRGSAYGGRVVRGLGYQSGLDNAWTIVPHDQMDTVNAGRRAVSRNALPADLGASSKTMLSGTLRARSPATLVPSSGYTRNATPTAGRRTVTGSSEALQGPVRYATRSGANPGATAGDGAKTGPATDPVRRATRAVSPDGYAQTRSRSGQQAATGAGGATRRAQPTTRAAPSSRQAGVNGAVRSTTNRAAPTTRTTTRGATTAPGSRQAVRRATTPATTRSVTGRATPSTPARYPTARTPYSGSGATRRATTRYPGASPSGAVRSPTSSGFRPPSSVRAPSGSGVRMPSPGRTVSPRGSSPGSVRSAPSPTRRAPSMGRSAVPSGRGFSRSGPSSGAMRSSGGAPPRAAAPPRSGGGVARRRQKEPTNSPD